MHRFARKKVGNPDLWPNRARFVHKSAAIKILLKFLKKYGTCRFWLIFFLRFGPNAPGFFQIGPKTVFLDSAPKMGLKKCFSKKKPQNTGHFFWFCLFWEISQKCIPNLIFKKKKISVLYFFMLDLMQQTGINSEHMAQSYGEKKKKKKNPNTFVHKKLMNVC